MQRAATFCISSSREKSAAKTRRARKTPSRCLSVCWTVSRQPSTSDSSTSHLSMTCVAFFPVHLPPSLTCHKLSQTFGVDEAALQEDLIEFKIVPYLKEQFLAAKDDLVLFCATKVPVSFPALCEAAQKFLVLFGRTWSLESVFSTVNHIKKISLCGCISNKHKMLHVFVPYLTTLARTDLVGEKMAPAKKSLRNAVIVYASKNNFDL